MHHDQARCPQRRKSAVTTLRSGQRSALPSGSAPPKAPGNRKQGMKVGIQRYDDPLFLARHVNDCNIFSLGHAALAHVLHVPADLPQQACCRARQALVDQDLDHAASTWITLSSRLHAAKSSAWRTSSASSSGYSRNSSSRFGYKATASTTRLTVRRMPRIQGCPFTSAGLTVMRSKRFMRKPFPDDLCLANVLLDFG